MSSEDDYDYTQHSTANTREKYSFLYPIGAGSSSGSTDHSLFREVAFLDRYRENVSIPPDGYARHREEKQVASADNDRAARGREGADSEGRDWAYAKSDWRHWDSKRHG
ncbi:hypothetical protein FOPE_10888 [Fonsecaea pedrosoi]|nr:hypothetical protein FOPE_10888 [Fonsecaea pedrosoi]